MFMHTFGVRHYSPAHALLLIYLQFHLPFYYPIQPFVRNLKNKTNKQARTNKQKNHLQKT